MFRYTNNYYEKYFILQKANEAEDDADYGAASIDLNKVQMRGTPTPGTVNLFSFCVKPAEYTIHAVDEAADGWWGGAYYEVSVDGMPVIQEEMNRTSSTRQTKGFTVALSQSAFTSFTENMALRGGGGAIFWEDEPPQNTEQYRNESTSNIALYGNYTATPARELTTTVQSYNTTSGGSMTSNPITIDLRDR